MIDLVIPCANCGKIRLSTVADEPAHALLHGMSKDLLKQGFAPNGSARQAQLGALKGEVQRFSAKAPIDGRQDYVILDVSDGCLNLGLMVFDNTLLDGSPFSNPEAIADATAVDRIPR